jgi:hypothetical protein
MVIYLTLGSTACIGSARIIWEAVVHGRDGYVDLGHLADTESRATAPRGPPICHLTTNEASLLSDHGKLGGFKIEVIFTSSRPSRSIIMG